MNYGDSQQLPHSSPTYSQQPPHPGGDGMEDNNDTLDRKSSIIDLGSGSLLYNQNNTQNQQSATSPNRKSSWSYQQPEEPLLPTSRHNNHDPTPPISPTSPTSANFNYGYNKRKSSYGMSPPRDNEIVYNPPAHAPATKQTGHGRRLTATEGSFGSPSSSYSFPQPQPQQQQQQIPSRNAVSPLYSHNAISPSAQQTVLSPPFQGSVISPIQSSTTSFIPRNISPDPNSVSGWNPQNDVISTSPTRSHTADLYSHSPKRVSTDYNMYRSEHNVSPARSSSDGYRRPSSRNLNKQQQNIYSFNSTSPVHEEDPSLDQNYNGDQMSTQMSTTSSYYDQSYTPAQQSQLSLQNANSFYQQQSQQQSSFIEETENGYQNNTANDYSTTFVNEDQAVAGYHDTEYNEKSGLNDEYGGNNVNVPESSDSYRAEGGGPNSWGGTYDNNAKAASPINSQRSEPSMKDQNQGHNLGYDNLLYVDHSMKDQNQENNLGYDNMLYVDQSQGNEGYENNNNVPVSPQSPGQDQTQGDIGYGVQDPIDSGQNDQYGNNNYGGNDQDYQQNPTLGNAQESNVGYGYGGYMPYSNPIDKFNATNNVGGNFSSIVENSQITQSLAPSTGEAPFEAPSQDITYYQTATTVFDWCIPAFSDTYYGSSSVNKIVSNPFCSENARLQAVIFPQGVGGGTGTHLSIFLRPIKSNDEVLAGDDWHRDISNMQISVIRFEASTQQYEKIFEVSYGQNHEIDILGFGGPGGHGFGQETFMSIEEVMDSLDEEGNLNFQFTVTLTDQVQINQVDHILYDCFGYFDQSCYLTPTFGTVDRIWQILAYPDGAFDSNGNPSLSVYLKPIQNAVEGQMSKSWCRLITGFTIQLLQGNEQNLVCSKIFTGSFIFSDQEGHDVCGWPMFVPMADLTEPLESYSIAVSIVTDPKGNSDHFIQPFTQTVKLSTETKKSLVDLSIKYSKLENDFSTQRNQYKEVLHDKKEVEKYKEYSDNLTQTLDSSKKKIDDLNGIIEGLKKQVIDTRNASADTITDVGNMKSAIAKVKLKLSNMQLSMLDGEGEVREGDWDNFSDGIDSSPTSSNGSKVVVKKKHSIKKSTPDTIAFSEFLKQKAQVASLEIEVSNLKTQLDVVINERETLKWELEHIKRIPTPVEMPPPPVQEDYIPSEPAESPTSRNVVGNIKELVQNAKEALRNATDRSSAPMDPIARKLDLASVTADLATVTAELEIARVPFIELSSHQSMHNIYDEETFIEMERVGNELDAVRSRLISTMNQYSGTDMGEGDPNMQTANGDYYQQPTDGHQTKQLSPNNVGGPPPLDNPYIQQADVLPPTASNYPLGPPPNVGAIPNNSKEVMDLKETITSLNSEKDMLAGEVSHLKSKLDRINELMRSDSEAMRQTSAYRPISASGSPAGLGISTSSPQEPTLPHKEFESWTPVPEEHNSGLDDLIGKRGGKSWSLLSFLFKLIFWSLLFTSTFVVLSYTLCNTPNFDLIAKYGFSETAATLVGDTCVQWAVLDNLQEFRDIFLVGVGTVGKHAAKGSVAGLAALKYAQDLCDQAVAEAIVQYQKIQNPSGGQPNIPTAVPEPIEEKDEIYGYKKPETPPVNQHASPEQHDEPPANEHGYKKTEEPPVRHHNRYQKDDHTWNNIDEGHEYKRPDSPSVHHHTDQQDDHSKKHDEVHEYKRPDSPPVHDHTYQQDEPSKEHDEPPVEQHDEVYGYKEPEESPAQPEVFQQDDPTEEHDDVDGYKEPETPPVQHHTYQDFDEHTEPAEEIPVQAEGADFDHEHHGSPSTVTEEEPTSMPLAHHQEPVVEEEIPSTTADEQTTNPPITTDDSQGDEVSKDSEQSARDESQENVAADANTPAPTLADEEEVGEEKAAEQETVTPDPVEEPVQSSETTNDGFVAQEEEAAPEFANEELVVNAAESVAQDEGGHQSHIAEDTEKVDKPASPETTDTLEKMPVAEVTPEAPEAAPEVPEKNVKSEKKPEYRKKKRFKYSAVQDPETVSTENARQQTETVASVETPEPASQNEQHKPIVNDNASEDIQSTQEKVKNDGDDETTGFGQQVPKTDQKSGGSNKRFHDPADDVIVDENSLGNEPVEQQQQQERPKQQDDDDFVEVNVRREPDFGRQPVLESSTDGVEVNDDADEVSDDDDGVVKNDEL